MPEINQLSAVDNVQSGDQVPIFSTQNGDARKASLSLLKTYFQEGAVAIDDKVTQYSAPSVAGFNTQIKDGPESVWLILTPVSAFGGGTITLPAVAKCADKQEVLVNSTQLITPLTIAGNGATVTGAPTSIAAFAFFRLRFDSVTQTWYRVG